MRLAGAACGHEVFAPDAVTLLHEVTHGALREIDRVATAALREAARLKKRRVERDVMARSVGIANTNEGD
jgi:type II secretory pathway predicted ATPase ExeA